MCLLGIEGRPGVSWGNKTDPSEIMDDKSGAKGPVDHNYMKLSDRTKSSTPLKNQQSGSPY